MISYNHKVTQEALHDGNDHTLAQEHGHKGFFRLLEGLQAYIGFQEQISRSVSKR